MFFPKFVSKVPSSVSSDIEPVQREQAATGVWYCCVH